LTASEAEMILHQPNIADPLGIRDRAMLEVFTRPECGAPNCSGCGSTM